MPNIIIIFEALNPKSDEELYRELQKQPTTNIEIIHIYGYTLGERSIPLLVSIIKNNFESLRFFGLWAPKSQDYSLREIIKGLAGCQQCSEININEHYRNRVREWVELFLSLNNLQTVYFVCFDGCLLTEFVPLVQQTNSLTSLSLIGSKALPDMFFKALRTNTTIKELRMSYEIPEKYFEECFAENNTIVKCSSHPRYGRLNRVCKELNLSYDVKVSVPKALESKKDIRAFLTQLKQHAEQWKKLKIIFLGHGEVGKTTLLNAIVNVQDWKQNQLQLPIPPPPVIDVNNRTIGVDVSTLKIGNGGEASVWDFGGQLEYAVSHQFLLSIEMVVYVLCYDYSAPQQIQQDQISYWLDFLQSTLPTQSITSQSAPKWQVMVVGTKSDKSISEAKQSISLPISPSWEVLWPNLPLHRNQNIVSSHQMRGIDNFLNELEHICNTIFEKHSLFVPQNYNSLAKIIKDFSPDQPIILTKQLEEKCSWHNQNHFLLALKYFHAIGHIVLLHERVCVQPQVVPKIMAEFISPEAVRSKLMTRHGVEILTRRQIGAVLSLKEHHKELDDKLALMEHIGVCFKLTQSIDTTSCFLFPSLAPLGDIQFTESANEIVTYTGLRITAPENKVFTSAFFCLVIIQLCKFLNITEKELIVVCKNGVVMECAGIFCGQLLLKLEKDMRSIVCLMLAFNPTVAFVSHTFCQLIQTKFEQYIGYTEHKLCPSCIEPNLPTEELESLKRNANLCLKHIIQSRQIPDSHQHVLINRCKTHNSDKHHIFVSYRVDSEGKQTPFTSVERAGGFVELVYWELAPQKLQYGPEILVFWDKMCLNDGCDWEEGFLHGITSSSVIILLLSNKVIEGICSKAPIDQDNVLVEYECALLQYKKEGKPVIPVFVADKDQNSNFKEFDFGKAKSTLPTVPHARKSRANNMIARLRDSLPDNKCEFLASIAQTLDEIFHMQGIFMPHRGEDKEKMKELSQRVLAVLNKHHL